MTDTPGTPDNLPESSETSGQKQVGYQVLARKYRPRTFGDLIGQQAIVRTLKNAFATGRVAHAFMLTGVRGVGKTTTARLLARALNYCQPGYDMPSVALETPGTFCASIMAGEHPDVLELDAASRTGVADMRDLLDGTRYSPISGRYKIYIVDEVHMLSTASFNALLKTLEEPPDHVKFIFATTEIRKVPVTVLSRCQRFDLRRLEHAVLAEHLGKIAETEGASICDDGLALIARAAEGSVRDGLSILDQAIVQSPDGSEITGRQVREMLGLGDRLRLLDVFEFAIEGQAKKAIEEIDDQIRLGAEPRAILQDMLSIAADMATIQAAGESYTLPGPVDWATRINRLAASLSAGEVQRNWKILLAGYSDLHQAPQMTAALRMVILRLVAASALPGPEEAARLIASGFEQTNQSTGLAAAEEQVNQPTEMAVARPSPSTQNTAQSTENTKVDHAVMNDFQDVLDLLNTRQQVLLWGQARQYIRVETFRTGYLACAVDTGAPKDLLRQLAGFLENETGMTWIVDLRDSRVETHKEKENRKQQEQIDAVRGDCVIAAALSALPGAEIVGVETPSDANQSGK